MFVYSNAHLIKDVSCVYIIAPYREGCYMFVYSNAHLVKDVSCVYIIAPYREGC